MSKNFINLYRNEAYDTKLQKAYTTYYTDFSVELYIKYYQRLRDVERNFIINYIIDNKILHEKSNPRIINDIIYLTKNDMSFKTDMKIICLVHYHLFNRVDKILPQQTIKFEIEIFHIVKLLELMNNEV